MTRSPLRILAVVALFACAPLASAASAQRTPPARPTDVPARHWGLVLHGGAGTLERAQMTPERGAAYRVKLAEALRAGYAVLDGGGASLDAVQAAIHVLEDSPLFNAGKGAVFTHAGLNEMDSSIMDGATMKAGAVAGVHHIRHPIDLARAVMDGSRHVLLTGEGAEEFALEQGMALVPASYFYTEARWQGLQRALEEERAARPDSLRPRAEYSVPEEQKFGTVGVVALDRAGNLAAGTSTGGTTNKRWGRVGDSPIIGAGTYASNRSCGVSATGTGEFFIRATVAHDICALVEYRGMTIQQAADEVVKRKLVAMGGDGGVVAMDPRGNWAASMNTSGMYRGHIGADGRAQVAIFADEALTPAGDASGLR